MISYMELVTMALCGVARALISFSVLNPALCVYQLKCDDVKRVKELILSYTGTEQRVWTFSAVGNVFNTKQKLSSEYNPAIQIEVYSLNMYFVC